MWAHLFVAWGFEFFVIEGPIVRYYIYLHVYTCTYVALTVNSWLRTYLERRRERKESQRIISEITGDDDSV
jgi:hypothetical protein